VFVFFQAEDGIRALVRSRGLGDVYKRQVSNTDPAPYWRCADIFEAIGDLGFCFSFDNQATTSTSQDIF